MSNENFEPDVKHLIEEGRKKGFLTYEEINRVLPDDLVSSEKLDALLLHLDEMGVQLIDETEAAGEAAAEEEEEGEGEEGSGDGEPRDEALDLLDEEGEGPIPDETAPLGTGSTEKIDDPVRMYLTQMGEIPLLSRDEEIMLAKKIELTRLLLAPNVESRDADEPERAGLVDLKQQRLRRLVDELGCARRFAELALARQDPEIASL